MGDEGAGGEEERKEVRLSAVQSSILLAVGLQRKSVEDVEVSFCSVLSFYSIPSPATPCSTSCLYILLLIVR